MIRILPNSANVQLGNLFCSRNLGIAAVAGPNNVRHRLSATSHETHVHRREPRAGGWGARLAASN